MHPLANEIVEGPIGEDGSEPSTIALHDRVEHETLAERLEAPTSPQRKRQMVIAWMFFMGWCGAIIIACIAVALIRGGFDAWSALILLAIPLGLLFTMPVWIAEEVKFDQDEAVRRHTDAKDFDEATDEHG